MPSKDGRNELISASVEAKFLERIKRALAPDETQAAFIREAVERELQRRTGEKS